MSADYISAYVDVVSAGINLSGVSLHKRGVIAVGNEADILAVVFAGIFKAGSSCKLSCLLFCHAAEREFQVRELRLSKRIEHIGLIF